MGLNDGTGDQWDDTAPANDDIESFGATEIRDLRKGVELRTGFEHTTFGSSGGSPTGGVHKPGSAVAYVNVAASPATLRPDGVTALTGTDVGRMMWNSDTGILNVLNSSGVWSTINLSNTSTLAVAFGKEHSASGPHLQGSATAYLVAAVSPPTKRPDGVTNLTTGDAGRLWVLSDSALIKYLDGSANWQNCVSAVALIANAVASGSLTDSMIASGTISRTSIAATGVIPNIAIGTYTGNATAVTVSGLGFQPNVIFTLRSDTNAACIAFQKAASANPGRLALVNQVDTSTFNHPTAAQFSAGGFTLTGSDSAFNGNTLTYFYLCLALP